MVQRRLNH